MKRTTAVLLAFLWLLLPARDADARSRHERVAITPLKEKGKVVGIRVKLTLRPEDYGHDRVRIGLSPGGLENDYSFREKASDPQQGHLLYQWKEITGLTTNQPKEVTLELRYADAPKVKPGSTVELVSAWSDSSRSYWHIWGLKTNISGPVQRYKLPDAPKPTARATSTRRTATTRARARSTRSTASSTRSTSTRASSTATATRSTSTRATSTRRKATGTSAAATSTTTSASRSRARATASGSLPRGRAAAASSNSSTTRSATTRSTTRSSTARSASARSAATRAAARATRSRAARATATRGTSARGARVR